VADKKRVKRSIRQLQRIKTWQLVILLLLASLITATFLRLNNIGMVERRDAVLAADKADNVEDVRSRLYDLQRYVSAHMNTTTGSVYLEEQYKRDSQKIVQDAGDVTNPNGNIYKKASEACDGNFTLYSQPYFQCYLSELEKYPSAENVPTTVALPKTSLYRHEFLAPAWSPDFAGWAVVLCLVIVLMIVARIIGLVLLRALLRRHYQQV
jgi:hypothetical protein